MTRTARPAATRNNVPLPDPAPAAPEWERLDDRALLARLVRQGPGDPDALAGRLLARFGGLAAVVSADPCELARVAQTRPGSLVELGVLRELAVRLARRLGRSSPPGARFRPMRGRPWPIAHASSSGCSSSITATS